MKTRLTIAGCLLITVVALVSGQPGTPSSPAAVQLETRCGWFSNPTPANISLYDRDGEWIIGVQGGYQVDGDWDWPVFAPRQWVKTNNNYGYGCACLRVRVDRDSHHVLEIQSAKGRTLAVCRKDRALKNSGMEGE